jgi:hypothetical protein
MKAIFFLWIVVFCMSLQAQSTIYFNKTFNLDTLTTTSGACLVLPNSYLFAGVCNNPNDTQFKQGLYFRTTDLYGETVNFHALNYEEGITWIISGGNLTQTNDNHFLIAASKTYSYTGIENDIILIKFDMQSGTIWKRLLDKPTTTEHPYQVISASDNGYIMAGVQRSQGQNNRLFVLKTDSLGNEEWSKQYHPLQHGAAFSIFETDTGYVVSGYMQYPDTDTDMFIMEIDKQGELLWDKHYGGNEIDLACLLLPIQYSDNYFLASAIRENDIRKPFIAKLDSIGNIVWNKMYDLEVAPLQEAPMQPTPDGGFVCLYSYDTELGYRAPWFWRFTATGDTLWTRRIPGAPSNNNTYLKDIAPTHDGGWVLSGFNYSEQSSWAVKLDSLGHTCSYLGCDSTATVIDNINTPSLSGQVFALSPNPATTQATLYIAQPAAGRQLRIYNMSGQQVKNLSLPDYIAQYHFSVADLPAGVYVCKVGDALGQKLVVGK